jgi:hypothetical protein
MGKLSPGKLRNVFSIPSSYFFAGDDPEHLASWCLDIEERRIRVNHSGESESLHFLLQAYRIIQTDPSLRSG